MTVADFMRGVELISAERVRQVAREGWNADHDDIHGHDELVLAAVQYALPADHRLIPGYDSGLPSSAAEVPIDWPWEDNAWKPTPDDRVRELVKAGALIAAEIDRQLRLAAQ